MRHKITPRILSLPPYISTTWQHIAALHIRAEGDILLLVIDLLNGNRIEIPRLEDALIEQIFAAHAAYNEGSYEPTRPLKTELPSLFNLHLPAKMLGEGIEKIAGVLQHNPEASDTPELPREFLEKIGLISQSIGLENAGSLPSPTEDCNCLFCQIARAMQAGIDSSSGHAQEVIEDEEVSDDDLRFKTWDINQTGHQMYEVVNPLDANEHYHVFLGDPLGCTCGKPNCEHICAVLKT